MTTALKIETPSGGPLISSELFDRLVDRIVHQEGISRHLADRVMDQALAFLVDIGWHVFILHTRDYAAFCERVAGRLLHHVPTSHDDPAARGETARETLARTVTAIRAAGFAVDAELWPQVTAVGSTGCHNGCHDDPPPDRG